MWAKDLLKEINCKQPLTAYTGYGRRYLKSFTNCNVPRDTLYYTLRSATTSWQSLPFWNIRKTVLQGVPRNLTAGIKDVFDFLKKFIICGIHGHSLVLAFPKCCLPFCAVNITIAIINYCRRPSIRISTVKFYGTPMYIEYKS